MATWIQLDFALARLVFVWGVGMLADIDARNLTTYGNKLGPSVEQLREKGKSWQQIIEGAAKPGGKDFDFSPPGFNGSPK